MKPVIEPQIIAVRTEDGHAVDVIALIPPQPRSALLWMPAMGVAARNYLPFAQELARAGIAVYLHEWRGLGSSSLRASRAVNWRYRQILEFDIPATHQVLREFTPDLPTRIGGHSLGGQLACCYAGLHSQEFDAGLWLACSGAPYHGAFAFPRNLGILGAVVAFPLLGWIRGYFPGKQLRFARSEARSMMADWSRSARTGKYQPKGYKQPLDLGMARFTALVTALVTEHDWLAPYDSTAFLVNKFSSAPRDIQLLNDTDMGVRADHFGWMAKPAVIAQRFIERA